MLSTASPTGLFSSCGRDKYSSSKNMKRNTSFRLTRKRHTWYFFCSLKICCVRNFFKVPSGLVFFFFSLQALHRRAAIAKAARNKKPPPPSSSGGQKKAPQPPQPQPQPPQPPQPQPPALKTPLIMNNLIYAYLPSLSSPPTLEQSTPSCPIINWVPPLPFPLSPSSSSSSSSLFFPLHAYR